MTGRWFVTGDGILSLGFFEKGGQKPAAFIGTSGVAFGNEAREHQGDFKKRLGEFGVVPDVAGEGSLQKRQKSLLRLRFNVGRKGCERFGQNRRVALTKAGAQTEPLKKAFGESVKLGVTQGRESSG